MASLQNAARFLVLLGSCTLGLATLACHAGADGRDGVDGQPGENGREGVDGQPGESGEPGQSGPPGEDGSPDTAEEIVEKLNGLGGSGPGIDADTIDGLDAEDFAPRSETKLIQLEVSANTVLTSSFDGFLSAPLLMPLDLATNTPITLHVLLGSVQQTVAACTLEVKAGVGSAVRFDNVGKGTEWTDIELPSTDEYHQPALTFEIAPSEEDGEEELMGPGTWVEFSVTRSNSDDCATDYIVRAVAFEYRVR